MSYNFALIGAAGYIAPRHMKAIKETGNKLVAVLDPYDGIGIIDSYFPEADYFSEPERFDRHLYKLRKTENKIHYVSICSPNYLHDAHIRLSLRNEAHAICEKPLVLNPWNLDALAELQEETGYHIYNILQLRLHPAIQELKKQIDQSQQEKHTVDLIYITSRGKWYAWSWKGDEKKSGGIATNIGIHFFDMLIWIFGKVKHHEVYLYESSKAAGYMELEKAQINWFLSIDAQDLPPNLSCNKRTYRSIIVDGKEIEFSEGFTDLHTESYRNILAGNGFGIEDVRPSIELTYLIRNSKVSSSEKKFVQFSKNKFI
ncbi:MAG: Gfo/Idh/MocA family oxidoreductase [Bacteroidales bacterium]|nr:Gfo/Idh/MocA family oxidoreductase [Bacteroidales bacterium]